MAEQPARPADEGGSAPQAGRAEPSAGELAAHVDELFRQIRRSLGVRPALPVDPDLTMGQLRLLSVLAAEQPLAVGQLAKRLGVGQPSTSRMVDRLVQERLVERWDDPSDRRRALVRVTQRGNETIESLTRPSEAERDEMLARLRRLRPEDMHRLLGGLRALVAAASPEPGG